jgi:hypothetical protein
MSQSGEGSSARRTNPSPNIIVVMTFFLSVLFHVQHRDVVHQPPTMLGEKGPVGGDDGGAHGGETIGTHCQRRNGVHGATVYQLGGCHLGVDGCAAVVHVQMFEANDHDAVTVDDTQ